ncbi:MAG: hypothetical protein DDT34_01288 [Firmicutes bacterium]|nr:hypothetical protein [Bacillota bacterium]
MAKCGDPAQIVSNPTAENTTAINISKRLIEQPCDEYTNTASGRTDRREPGRHVVYHIQRRGRRIRRHVQHDHLVNASDEHDPEQHKTHD